MNNTYESQAARVALARRLAQEAMVLLKNQGALLPLPPGKTVAVLGRTQLDAVIGGGGSGASFSEGTLQIREELGKAGLILEPSMDGFYQEVAQKQEDKPEEKLDFVGLVASGLMYEIFGKYHPAEAEPLPEEALWEAAGGATDTALVILGRTTGGEECDRRVEDDYNLTPSEEALLDLACAHFPHVAVVFNGNGLVDMSCTRRPEIQAALFMGPTGEQAAGALADLLTGKVTPSGKLSVTAALRYEDYPTARHFSCLKDDPSALLTYESYGLDKEANGSKGFAASPVTVYQEDVYVGYRYFDTFQKPVLYPFGFGLSYADFAWETEGVALDGDRLTVEVKVTNTSGTFPGKEAVQLYVQAPWGKAPCGTLKKPWQELKAIAKTPELKPGESCQVKLCCALGDWASFDEAKMAYVLEAGAYVVRVGTGSQNTVPAAVLELGETLTVREVTADIGIAPANKGKIQLLEPETQRAAGNLDGLPRLTISRENLPMDEIGRGQGVRVPCGDRSEPTEPKARPEPQGLAEGPSTLADVAAGRVSMEAFVGQMSVKELAVLCNGFGPGLPFGGIGHTDIPVTIQDDAGEDIGYNSHPTANPGYCNPAIKKYGILSGFYKDGPASVGGTAWPTGMMIACTFNPALAYEFGSACGYEAASQQVGSWLAPGMNLIRTPIQGRAFEYFSEDPCLCGLFGTQTALGAIQNNNLTVCPKHFALNEQETYRRGNTKKNIDAVDTIVSARAARELYLRPFEAVVTQAKPTTLMTSFNKVNGAFAAGNRVLCTEILRGEWGYGGVVVTDWGDMDIVVDGADAVQAGNDVIMPGGPPVIAQVLKGYEEGRADLPHLREAVAHLMRYLISIGSYEK